MGNWQHLSLCRLWNIWYAFRWNLCFRIPATHSLSRRFLAHFRSYTCSLVQRIWCLCSSESRQRSDPAGQPRKSARSSIACFQLKFRLLPGLHGYVGSPNPPLCKEDANKPSGLICFVFLICSLRTNIVFFTIFLTLVCAFGCLAGAYFNLALVYENEANVMAAARAAKLVVVSLFPFCHARLMTKDSR